jgi:hypothetical protein
MSQNPTVGVRKIKYATDGHHGWSPDEVTQYRDRHLLGSKARLALDLLLAGLKFGVHWDINVDRVAMCSFFACRNLTRPLRTCCGPTRTASSRRPPV